MRLRIHRFKTPLETVKDAVLKKFVVRPIGYDGNRLFSLCEGRGEYFKGFFLSLSPKIENAGLVERDEIFERANRFELLKSFNDGGVFSSSFFDVGEEEIEDFKS